jgi:rhodanese-related sulfurtransferase
VRSFPAAVATTIRQAAGVLVVGIAFSLLANFVSPRGISLQRDYFPVTQLGKPPVEKPGLAVTNSSVPNSGADQSLFSRLSGKGLGIVSVEEVIQLTKNPLYQQQFLLLVDARDERHYLEGHIPGALQFDRYYPERYLPNVLPIAINAEQIVVYCTGGNCEDSEYAAIALTEAGIPAEKIFVYPGGIAEWRNKALPIEVGASGSGSLQKAQP